MNIRFRPSTCAWILTLLGACGYLGWTNWLRIQHVNYATASAQVERKVDPASPTGYADELRQLIVPEHHGKSYDWIAQTQQMLARGEWRVRHIDYENAPVGHEVNSASPYRWWLGFVAWLDHVFSGRPIGQSVEQAALYSDPLIHLGFLLVTTVFVALRFGALSAIAVSIGLVVLFPLAGEFIPGAPDDYGLSVACAAWSVLLVLTGIGGKHATSAGGGARWFFAAGLFGGLGLWLNVSVQAPIVVGLALGALLAAWIVRGGSKKNPGENPSIPPWRIWSYGGALASLVMYLIEYFPAHLGSWQLRAIHPLYGLAWLGLGELVAQLADWTQGGKSQSKKRALVVGLFASVALAALPVAMYQTSNVGFLAVDFPSLRLSKMPNGAVAINFFAWFQRDGFTGRMWAVILPVLAVFPAIWLLTRSRTALNARSLLAIALGPVLLAAGFACRQLIWWNVLDAVLLMLVVVILWAMDGAGLPNFARRIAGVGLLLALIPGAVQLAPSRNPDAALSQKEVEGLIERDLVQWLARHAVRKHAIVLATPDQTATMAYYGSFRGLGTLGWENKDGFGAALRIVSATTEEEALALIQKREVAYIVIPSWDTQLDEYARLGLGQVEGSFIDRLHQWSLPRWLRPVPYQLPTITGLEGQSVVILEVVDEQPEATAASRITEYFAEMGQLDRAATMAQSLKRFPADLGSTVARALVEIAQNDTDAFSKTIELLRSRLAARADRNLAWDRRVSLAVVLTRGKQMELAREQVRRCLADIDEAKLRFLSTGSLYRLQVLAKAFDLPIADSRLRELALDLLPADLRSRL